MAAPAEGIVIPNRNNGYEFSQGTSLAAPMVSATASLLMGTRADGKTHLRNGTPASVDRVKNLLFNSGTLIQTNGALGLRKSNVDNSVPNGSLLNMGKALELAIQMDPTKNYVRLFNTDYYSEAVINNNRSNLLSTYYKEDKIKEVPIGLGTLDFNTFNKSCVYSWGYQLWQQGIVTTERVKGIAGKRKPVKNDGSPANNVSGSTNITGWDSSGWINQNNSGMATNSAGEFQAANIYFQYYY